MSTKKRHIVSKEYQEKCEERIIIARTAMIMNCPFFGILAARLELVPNNTWCRTLAVDGKHLFYNTEFIMGIEDKTRRQEYEDKLKSAISDLTPEQINDALNGLSDKNLIAAVCHEILHCAYNHFLRRGARDPKKWNKAADYAINQIIKRDPLMGEIKNSWLFDVKFDGMPAEEIYNILEDEEGQGGGGSAGGKGQRGGSLDQHDTPEDNHSEEDEDEQRPEFTEEELEQFMDEFKDAMINAAMVAGNLPAEIARMIDDFKEPKIDWRSKLNRTIRSLIKNDVSYMMPSRRSWINGIGYGMPIFPGLKPDQDIDICVALDASGSISTEMLKDFLSEVYGITDQFTQFKIRILTFDTRVYEVHDYVTGEEQKILEYPVKGGGGTDFEAVWKHMKKEEYVPKQLIMFTDGYPCGSWGDPDYCDTLFIVHSNPKAKSPFGVTVHYEEEVKMA